MADLEERCYLAIDLKSFYASCECVERGLDPLNTNLLVADESKTDKTICLAVSPSLKSYGISGRARLFEANQAIKVANAQRERNATGHKFSGSSYFDSDLRANKDLAIDFIIAPPQMAKYVKYSTDIYQIYLKYVAPEDIHVYSIDEVFMDITDYIKSPKKSPREFAMMIILDVLYTTGITATAGIGTNLYLSKIAMDIVAKHIPADENGVRIAELDEMSYRQKLWNHRPLTDFWRVGKGYATKLEAHGMYTMGDVARHSVIYEKELYDLFGINAELLIDHAWGWEPCTIADIKACRPKTKSVNSGQVLSAPYPYEKAKTIVHEMADLLALDLVAKRFLCDQLVMTVGYDVENIKSDSSYKGETHTDHYGRTVPKEAHGTINLKEPTSSSKLIISAALKLFDRIIDPALTVRRVYISASHIIYEEDMPEQADDFTQVDLFGDFEQDEKEKQDLEREKRQQKAILDIQSKYGKNAILKGVNFKDGATTIERNGQIGGHKA